MRDDQEFNVRFVGLVEVYPCLYDNTREDYNVSHVQDRAWVEIAKLVGEQATSADCKNRWKNLRGSYTKHLKKYKQSGSGVTSTRPYYLTEHMQFILPFTKYRHYKGNIELPANKSLASLHDEASTEGLDTQSMEGSTDKDGQEQTDDEEPQWPLEYKPLIGEEDKPMPTCEKKIKQVPTPYTEQKSKRSKITHETINKSAFENKKQHIPSMSANDDADAHFLLSLLPDLKKMTDGQKLKFKVEMLILAAQIAPSHKSTSPSIQPMQLVENDPTKIILVPPDHIDTFLAGIISSMKKLRPYNQHIAKGQIFNVVHKLESQELCTSSGSCVSTEHPQHD